MNTGQIIPNRLEQAIKVKDQTRMDTHHSIMEVILDFQKSDTGRELNEEEEIKILNSLAKKKEKAIKLYEKGGINDLAGKMRQELLRIQHLLQLQTSEVEIRSFLEKIMNEVNAPSLRDLGKVMGQELKGKADGSLVQSIAEELLTQPRV